MKRVITAVMIIRSCDNVPQHTIRNRWQGLQPNTYTICGSGIGSSKCPSLTYGALTVSFRLPPSFSEAKSQSARSWKSSGSPIMSSSTLLSMFFRRNDACLSIALLGLIAIAPSSKSWPEASTADLPSFWREDDSSTVKGGVESTAILINVACSIHKRTE
jgi:hypothetical protein